MSARVLFTSRACNQKRRRRRRRRRSARVCNITEKKWRAKTEKHRVKMMTRIWETKTDQIIIFFFSKTRTFALFDRVLNLLDVAVASRTATTSRKILLFSLKDIYIEKIARVSSNRTSKNSRYTFSRKRHNTQNLSPKTNSPLSSISVSPVPRERSGKTLFFFVRFEMWWRQHSSSSLSEQW